ncbi:serine carboxypeptidase-like protein [Tribonema minus]|uniref:Carboxypeptidase n=1 Tax=Tribonema minus TaxID=303371 RepID=A0A836CDJ2_9STRA|nr:serine carboxypeptidase-like protein [Tribonema minus]
MRCYPTVLLLFPLLVEHGAVRGAAAATEPKYGAAALEDEVSWSSLPGAEDLGDIKNKFRMFAGYLPINRSKGKGGNLVLKTNPSSWNAAVNMLYIETPCGVGFSYRKGAQSYDTGDARVARDNAAVLQTFLERYPHLRANDLHIASESYGGHYMPTLALEILRQNDAAKSKADMLNLKGILLGNPCVDYGSNRIAKFDKLWGASVVSKDLYQTWRSVCAKGLTEYTYAPRCGDLEYKMLKQLGTINPYGLDYPICNIGGQTSPQGLQLTRFGATAVHGARAAGANSEQPAFARCFIDYLGTYFNQPAVKRALHAMPAIEWQDCNDYFDSHYNEGDRKRSVVPLYKQILDEHPEQRILIFSGDNDSVCATGGTQVWIYSLGRSAVSLWQQWRLDGQPAGYATKFSGGALAFVTVHSAGHEVPAYQPERALVVLERYLDGSWFAKRDK